MPIKSSPQTTKVRLDKLRTYFRQEVLGDDFVCTSYSKCKASCPALTFYEGQLHHVGDHYDLEVDEKAMRIVVVGQEYGHCPPRVDLASRHEMILDQVPKTWRGRNTHMKGTTTVLRLLVGRDPGEDQTREQLLLEFGEETHLFEGFALVNYLLCSAVEKGRMRGMASDLMIANCARHFRTTIAILEPTLLIVQGYTVRDWIGRAYQCPWNRENIECLDLDGKQTMVLTFYHPSAPAGHFWGQTLQSKYLSGTVVPTISRAR